MQKRECFSCFYIYIYIALENKQLQSCGMLADVTKDSHSMVICFAPLTFWHSLHWARACLLSTPLTPCLGFLSSSSFVELLKASGEAVNAKEDELKANACGCSKVCAQGISVFCCLLLHETQMFDFSLHLIRT